MISAFGVDHGGISKLSRGQEHDRRMSNAAATLGGASTALAAGSGIVGSAERRGHDPMGFTAPYHSDSKPMKAAKKAKILRRISASHFWQMRTLGGLGGVSLGAAGAYKYKQKHPGPVHKRDWKKTGRHVANGGLDTGTAVIGGSAVYHGQSHGRMLGQQAKLGLNEARASHHLLMSHKNGHVELTEHELNFHKNNLKLGRRVAGVKGAGALGAATVAGAGGVGLYEVGRHNANSAKQQWKARRR